MALLRRGFKKLDPIRRFRLECAKIRHSQIRCIRKKDALYPHIQKGPCRFRKAAKKKRIY